MGRFPRIAYLTRDRPLLGEKRPLSTHTCLAFIKNNLARHQVVLYVCKCIDYRVAGDLRNNILPMNDFEPKMESLTTTNVRKTIFNQLISLCEPVP